MARQSPQLAGGHRGLGQVNFMLKQESPANGTGPHAAPPGDGAATPEAGGRRGAFVLSMIVLTGVVVLAMMSLIYYRAVTVVEPNAAIVVQGDESHDGAVIVVDGQG